MNNGTGMPKVGASRCRFSSSRDWEPAQSILENMTHNILVGADSKKCYLFLP
jgi:hypothetical protein